MEFLHDVLAVGDGCGEADVKLASNFLVDVTFGKQYRHFHFTG